MIKFGTDGWRAVIADEFTFANVRILSQAAADFFKSQSKKKIELLVGYDTRFLSNEYAKAAAEVLAGNNIKTFLTVKPTPTPVVSFSIADRKLDGGVLITASHNPPQFNGVKIRTCFGGSPDEAWTKKIESRLLKSKIKSADLESAAKKNLFRYTDTLDESYFKFLNKYVNVEKIKKSNFKILIDPMFGAGIGYLYNLLKNGSIKLFCCRSSLNPSFGGVNPEPIEKNLLSSMKMVKKEKFDIAVATDGDADRVGIIDENGRFISTQQVFMLLFAHLIEDKKMKGGLARTISATNLLDKIAQRHKLNVYETPVGFKHIVSLMCKEDILIGGEESGGYSFKGCVPERDGILAGLLVLEMMAERRQKISEILKSIEKIYGRSRFLRKDLRLSDGLKEKFLNKIKKNPPLEINGKKIKKMLAFDGIKFMLEDESWLLLRFSGTEPLLRIYAETNYLPKTKQLIAAGIKLFQTK